MIGSKMKGKLMVIFIAVITLPVILSLESSYEFSICANSSDQQAPAVYGDIVIWQDNRNGNWDIYGYNLSTGEEFQITSDLDDQEYPAIYNDLVIWVEDHEDMDYICGLNLLTKKEVQISTAQSRKSHPAIYKDIVVWEDDRNYLGDIYGYDLSESTEFRIASSPGMRSHPALYEDIVVWQGWKMDPSSDFDYHIYGYNLSTRREFQITAKRRYELFAEDRCHPAIYGDIVIWTEDDDNHIYGFDLSTAREFRIAVTQIGNCDTRHSHIPAIYENIVVWVDCRNGNEDIYGYDLLLDQELQLTADKSCQRAPEIHGDIVTWEDNRNGNWDIYGLDLKNPITVTDVKSKTRFYLTDLFYILLYTAPVAAVIIISWKAFSDIRQYSDRAEAILKYGGKPRDFRRSEISATLQAGMIIFNGVVGLINFALLETPLAFYFFLLPILCFAVYLWYKKVPFIRMTSDEMILLPDSIGIGKKNKNVRLDIIKKVNFILWTEVPYRAEVLLMNDEKITIDLSNIHKGDRKSFVQVLSQSVRERSMGDQHSVFTRRQDFSEDV